MGIKERKRRLNENVFTRIKSNRPLTVLLSVLVVLIVAYALVLPAKTLSKKEASRQGGVDVADARGKDFALKISWLDEKQAPEDVSVSVNEIREKADPEEFAFYYDLTSQVVMKEAGEDELPQFSFAGFYNITLSAEDDKSEIPDQFRAAISYDQPVDVKSADQVHIVRFTEDKEKEEITAEVLKASSAEADISMGKMSGAEFDADCASVYAVVCEQDTVEDSSEPAAAGTKLYSGDGFDIKTVYDKEAGIPADTDLLVREIRETHDKKEYQDYYDEALKALQAETGQDNAQGISFAKFYDITFRSDGEEIEPADDVKVTISFDEALKAKEADHVRIVHFTENKKCRIAAEVLDPSDVQIKAPGGKLDKASFTTDSFSVYAVVYTVDFSYSVDGEEYDFSLQGGRYISFEQLVKMLGISDDARAFAAEVEDIRFSDSDLMWVGKADYETTVGELKEANGLKCQYSAEMTDKEIEQINAQTVEAAEWSLISLKPFESEEMLTVTMKNGEVFEIRVTDASYDCTVLDVNNLDGKTGALVRTRNNLVNAVQSTALNNNHLQAVSVTINSNTLITEGSTELTKWTFEKVQGTNNQYYISASNGYLNIGAGSATVTSTPQALEIQTSNNQIRIKRTQDNYALNNTSNQTANGYGSWNGSTGYENEGEWFTVYELPVPQIGDRLNGQSLAIINNRDGGNSYQALRDEIDGTKDSRGYYVSGNNTSYTNVDGVDYSSSGDVFWTFEYVRDDNYGSYYRIRTDNGYLSIDPDVTRKSDMPSNQSHAYEHALNLVSAPGDGSANDGTLVRIVANNDGTYLLQNRNGVCLWNYGNNQFWLSTIGEDGNQTANSRFRLAQRPEANHVTVHYVDRNGNVLTGVQYTGGNSAVIDNHDGTFTIPYDISGNVDVRANFNFDNVAKDGLDPAKYTYANTHLAGVDAQGTSLTHNGYLIDSGLVANNGQLYIYTDGGDTWPANAGNLKYGSLQPYSLSNVITAKPVINGSRIDYASSVNKDIYVVLDPLPGESAASASGGAEIDAEAPKLTKTMVPNNDGTYTLKLTVDAHARNASDTNKANVLFVVDTSSSMRNRTQNGSTRIIDTYNAVRKFGDKLLSYNNSEREDAVEVSMITFDGSVDERLDWTNNKEDFDDTVDEYLRYYWLHTGTDWEDSLKEALNKVLTDTDADPTFVVFFTDGEPSQYSNFNGAGENNNIDVPDPITGGTAHDTDVPGASGFYSYFLSREGSKDEMRAIVDTGAQLYGIYAYNTTNESYNGYNGPEDGARMLHNAIKYGYNTADDLSNKLFYEATNTAQLQGAFDKIFNLITEKVGFSNVVVKDGIAGGVTSTTVLEGDVSAFNYTIKDDKGRLAYKVTVAPNGVPDGMTVEDGTPLFWFSDNGPPVVGETRSVPVTKITGNSADHSIQTNTEDVSVYYYKDDNDKEYIMPIATTTGEDVSWDLSPLGLLKDSYSYDLSFVVWPNQESYDLVADLNNGKRPDIEATANWNVCELKTDAAGRQYRQGGFPGYPFISRYEDDGVYSAMSNTDQRVEYYKVDEEIVNGEEVTTITGKNNDPVPPPGPMPLTASYSRIEKLWNVERDPGIFAQYLYNTDGTSKQFKLDFDVFQGDNTTVPYTTESLGWDQTVNNGQGAYVWAPGDTMSNVTYAGHAHQIGTRWVTDFSIATGLMLTVGEMNRLGLNKSLYTSTVFEGETYYILEPGHDYTIKEHGAEQIGYEFDFISPVYHPMLVDGVLRNVEIKYEYRKDDEGHEITDDQGNKIIDTATISSITGSDEGLSGLEVQNTLRGYINLNKIVVDEDHTKVEDDNTKFEYLIKLESNTDPGPFKGDHIPWYGINGLYYNDGHENYYQVYEAAGGVWMIRNEAGREYPVTSEGFDPDNAEAQEVTYTVNGQDKHITIYGNQMTADDDGKIAEARTLAITQNETLYIANVPMGTKYTITEADADGYYLTDILKEVKHGTDVEQSSHVPQSELSGRTAAGTIVTNRDNHVTYTNQIRTGALDITKTIQKNGATDTAATGTFYYAVYDKEYDPSAVPPMEPVRKGSIEVTTGGTATVRENKLKMGTYFVYELTGENGVPVTSGGIFNGGKYYAVTTSGSPAEVEEDGTASVGIVNNYVTTPVEAAKTWADNNPQGLTVYFKLFYETSGGVAITTGTPLKAVAPGESTVTWDDMPKYDQNGNEYNYIVREYILDDEHGEFEEGDHKYTEAAPNGYVNTEAGLSVTNSRIETYEPVTTYSGLKVWVDTANGSMTRPDGLTVTLMIDKEPYNDPEGDEPVKDENDKNLKPDWVTVGDNQWRYTFTKLPMFDDQKNIIKYYVVETPVDGYDDEITNKQDTEYVFVKSTLDHTENDAYPQMNSDADLVYAAVRIQHGGYLHHIWTQRIPTDEEKNKLINLVNQDLVARGLADPAATVDNVHWVSGLPINHEFVWSPTDQGAYKVSFTRQNTNTIHIKVDNHNAFSNICYGTLQYDYTAGSTDFKNELETETYSVEKTWGNGVTPPEGAVAVVELQGTVQRPKNPQPEGATEIQYDTVPIDLAAVGVTEKIQVTLNGGAEGGDDTSVNKWKYTWKNLPQYNKEEEGDPLRITYSVKEISYKIGGHAVNLKDFEPDEDTSTPGTTIITNQIPSFSFEILKIDAENNAKPLPGATFTIKQIKPTTTASEPEPIGDASPSTPVTTTLDEGYEGKVRFNDIPLGYYEIEETGLPAGYIQTGDGKFYIRVDTDDVKLMRKVVSEEGGTLSFEEVQPGAGGRIILGNVELTKSGIITFTVENEPGKPLPHTGGAGTALIYLLGILLTLGGGLLLIRRRRAAVR